MSRNRKLATAFALGILSFFLAFFLGEGVRIPSTVPGAETIDLIIFIVGIGAFFMAAEYYLSRGNPRAVSEDWPIMLALNAALLLLALGALTAEPNKTAVLGTFGIAGLAVASSLAGAALAARAARHP